MSASQFRNPMDALVLDSVRSLLRNPSISINDDFFEIGGTSIVAVRLAQVLSEALGIPRIVRMIFRDPVLRDLSDALTTMAGNTA